MLDELDDNKLREAAANYKPSYDNDGWDKMQQMLDKELPQEKKNKKLVLLLLFLLLLTGSGIFFIIHGTVNHLFHSVVTLQKGTEKNLLYKTKTVVDVAKQNLHSQKLAPLNIIKNGQKPLAAQLLLTPEKPSNGFTKPNDKTDAHLFPKTTMGNDDNIFQDKQSQQITNLPLSSKKDGNHDSTSNHFLQDTAIMSRHTQKIASVDTISSYNNKKRVAKVSGKFYNNFGISFSTGFDYSEVHLQEPGKVTAFYGAGLSYSLKKFSLRTGFYVFKKIYSAGGSDYHSSAYPGTDYLDKVNADCIVYEIPVNVSYTFSPSRKHSWFASAGIASYLMKKENYQYYYKYPSGQTYNTDWSVNNKNRNYFSMATLSAGYQYFFNKRFSFTAEPYINAPLSGVGAGKIKLNSGGMLFSLTIKPSRSH